MAENLELRRTDLIQLAQMATNQQFLMEGQKQMMAKLDRLEERLRPMETKVVMMGSLAAMMVSAGTALLIEKLKGI